jgi:DNA-binding transcriptional regulator YiaG
MHAEAIQRLRRALGENPDAFGLRFQVSPRTVENWEQGRNRPHRLVIQALVALADRQKTAKTRRKQGA